MARNSRGQALPGINADFGEWVAKYRLPEDWEESDRQFADLQKDWASENLVDCFIDSYGDEYLVCVPIGNRHSNSMVHEDVHGLMSDYVELRALAIYQSELIEQLEDRVARAETDRDHYMYAYNDSVH